MGLSLRPFGKKIRDIFDANTESDQQKRIAAGQPRMYQDQQRGLSNVQKATNAVRSYVRLQNPIGLTKTVSQPFTDRFNPDNLSTADKISAIGSRAVNTSIGRRLSSTPSGKLAGVVNRNIAQPLVRSASDLQDLATTDVAPERLGYTNNARGLGKFGSDVLNVVSAVYGGASAKALARIPTVANVGRAFARGIPGGLAAGTANTVQQTGTVKLRDLPTIGATGALGGAANVVMPLAGNLASKGAKAITSRKQPQVSLQSPAVKPVEMPIKKLTSYEGAPDKARVQFYKDKIQAGEPVKPLVVKKDSLGNLGVDDGKHRLQAMQELGIKKAPVQPLELEAKFAATQPKPSAQLKTRGFKKNVFKDNFYKGNTTAKEVVEAMPGYKPITNKQTLNKAASTIGQDPASAYANIVTKPQLTSAQDVATGNILLRNAIEAGDIESAIQVGTKLGIDGTKLGQAVQAYATFKKTTPEGIVRLASRKATSAGKELSPEITSELVAKAKSIAEMPEGLERAKATQELLGQADGLGRTWRDTVQEIISSPRSIMASADLSAPLRQGAVLGSRYPGKFTKNFEESVRYFFSPGAFEKSMYEISQRPTYNLMKTHKLAVDGAKGITGTEEQFMKSIVEGKWAKRLGVGHIVAASDRAYTGFLTKFRADVFDSIVSQSEKTGVKLDDKALGSLAKFVNSASGRGSGKNLDKYGGLLSQALFSPKLWKSRIDTLNPVYYARLDPVARKLALQSAASFVAITSTILGLAKLAGADVETDPRSADFAKIKVGNTRYDILGGHQQQARFAAQMISGQKINSETGEIQTLGPERGFGKPSRLDLAYQFVENKENPTVGFVTKALRGTDPAGNKINLAAEAAKLGIPLTLQQTYETAKDQGSIAKGIAMNIPGTFGIGVQTYGKKAKDDKPKDDKKIADKDKKKQNKPSNKTVRTRKGGGSGGGSRKNVGSEYKYAVSLSAGGKSVRPKVSVKQGKKIVARKTSKPKVKSKKSLV